LVVNMSVALKKSPLSRVKDEFGGKDKLVDKIVGVLDAGDEGKDVLRKRLLGVANGKLIRLFSVATRTKQAGGHDKLAATTAERQKHGKDKDYVTKLGALSDARLLDMLQAADRAQGNVAAAAPAAKADKAAKAKVGKAARAEKKAAEPVKGKGKTAPAKRA
jgi:hypothetical protein